MKKLIDYKEEIHKCSKCGLCQSVCPVYEQTGNDCSVSRGKFIMLNGIIKGELKLNKNINKYLDMCLKCNACSNFCPSEINARKIFLTAKAEYFKTCQNSYLIQVFQSKFIFNLFLIFIEIATTTYRFLKLDMIIKKFYPIFSKMGNLGKKIILTNEFISYPKNLVPQHFDRFDGVIPFTCANCLPQKIRKRLLSSNNDLSSLKIIYFKGCVNEHINPRAKIATENVLELMGIKVLAIKFGCCGVPFLSCGNSEQFKKQALFNLSKIPNEFDYFLTDCASCQNAFVEYKDYINDIELLKKIDFILEKSINVNDFILEKVQSINFKKRTSFTFHKPCHLEDITLIRKFLTKAKNVEYIEMNEFDKCCGFSGEFAIKNSEISKKISEKKAKNALNTNADYILTTCPSCMLGLIQGLVECEKPFNPKHSPLSFVELISMAEKIT